MYNYLEVYTKVSKDREGSGTPAGRFYFIMAELEKRFPHPRPYDSTKAPELYALEAIDELIKRAAV
jgi:hypothetical protein